MRGPLGGPDDEANREIVPPHFRDAKLPHRSPSLGFPMGKFPMKLALHRSPRMDVPGAADIAVHTTAIATWQPTGPSPVPPTFPQNFLEGVCKILAHGMTTPDSTADVLAKTLRTPRRGPYPPSEPRDRSAVPPRREARPPKPVSGFPDGKVPMKLALHRSPRMNVPGAADIAVNTTTIATRRFPGPRPISPKIGLIRRLPYDLPSARHVPSS